ncbi:helix-turn-helix transcriptional regulator [Paenibacillus urinalis]|uniref:Helix-turn-helix transcriptional regulator n=1 Tax=Paenibacillus urinalis TaxID=521520 RepID=A0ABY7XFF3_9BACL|nr:helix-turn-helix transcriptional regulator [Paenibacillus urinalis]OMG46270.1 transcriptional regulator [Paenibacillus macerans]WDH98692.1 helix-turn-helix transcriptional regulator [Paenibacillus urinalis]WDI02385.1 helix-turn-helix transcriptional regulator [Paenibacillus urinalis]
MSAFLQLVGARIRQLRLLRGMSQAKLAEAADLQVSYIGGVERGERNISLNTLEKIASALEVEPIEALKFGQLDEVEGVTEKHHILSMHLSLLEERSLAEVKLVHRITKDMISTYNELEKEKY